jgi:glycosyltransferase involved in cell wall biosynthesis
MVPPKIAVIVGAYSRRQYVRAALRSLERQTLPRADFEVVVTKDFDDPALDAELAEQGAIVLKDAEPQIGRWLRHAVDASHAPVVTFLDDDDEYAPDRLARLRDVWQEHPDVGFYRNRVCVIDEAGRPVPPDRWRPLETDSEFDRLGPVHLPPDQKGAAFDLGTRRTHATFNTSSMAIRRELLEGDLGEAFERTQLEDQYLFLAGVLAPYGVFLDDRRLTRFRFYGGNVSRRVAWLHHAEYSYEDMSRVAATHGRGDVAEWLAHRSVHYGRMFRGGSLMARIADGAPRREVAGRTGSYLRFLGRHPEEPRGKLDTWAASLYGFTYCLAPSLARSVRTARSARSPDRGR